MRNRFEEQLYELNCEIIEMGGDDIKVKGIDGKEFTLNLSTGKTKKV